MSYKELQQALKELRNQGIKVNVKLNSTKVALQAEYDRLTSETKVDELQMLRDELAAAKQTIAQQAARIQELEQQQQPQAEQQPQEHTDKQVQAAIESTNENYASFPEVAAKLNLQPEQLKQLVIDLDKRGLVELSTIAEPKDYETANVDKWGSEQISGGSLYFISWNQD